ncbi:MAG: D-ribose pyranase [Verrucomicrobia bacterium]|nr:D-ribose pyranase [Verrucomicrobiota bacterium]
MEHDVDSLVDRWTREQKDRLVERCRAGAPAPAEAAKDGSSAQALAKAETPRLLNSMLAGALREIGHTQMLLLADKGFPVPPGVETIDLALTDNVPTILDVIRAITADFDFDRVLITDEMRELSPERPNELEALTKKPFETFPHVAFKHLAAHARLAIRTGDATPYANCILVCG